MGEGDVLAEMAREFLALLVETEIGEGWVAEAVVALDMSVGAHGNAGDGRLMSNIWI